MNSLHIKAILESHKSVLGYADIVECEQTLLAIIDGTRPVEGELRELESFRKTLMTLVREALVQMTARQDLEQPLARLHLWSGEEFSEYTSEFDLTLIQRKELASCWTLSVSTEQGSNDSFSFDSADDAVRHMGIALNECTAAWVSELEFQVSRVDS
jgi:hypothetical protein